MRNVRQILEDKGNAVVCVTAEMPVREVIRKMAEHHIGSVLVTDSGHILGICTERDYARKVILQGRSSAETPVRDIMSSPVLTVSPDHTARQCMTIMTQQRVRHLPVLEDDAIIGMISIGDLLKTVIEDQQQEIEQLHQYIAG